MGDTDPSHRQDLAAIRGLLLDAFAKGELCRLSEHGPSLRAVAPRPPVHAFILEPVR